MSRTKAPAKKRSTRTTKGTGASLRLADFTGKPEIDLLTAARERSAEYAGSKWICLHVAPKYVRTSFLRVKARAATNIDSGAMAMVAIEAGVRRIACWDACQDYLAEKQRSLTANMDADDADELAMFFSQTRYTIADFRHGGFYKWSVATTETLRKDLAHFASELDLTGSTLYTVSLMETLRTQPGVLRDHACAMNATIQDFEAFMARRARKASILVRTLVGDDE